MSARSSPDDPFEVIKPMDKAGRARFETAAATHPGRSRGENEDAYLDRAEAGLWAVADGMGGHHAGQFASRTVIAALEPIGRQASAAQLLARCEACVVEANTHLLSMAEARGVTIGTTLAVLLVHEVRYACVWSGDSRIYRVRSGSIEMMSRDHTEVQDLVERGIMTPEEGRTSPLRNVITRAIGVCAHAELEIAHGVLETGDTFLLCSDGLTNHVSDGELAIALTSRPPREACAALLDLALERGGTDNITLVVVGYNGEEAGRPPRRTTIVDALRN